MSMRCVVFLLAVLTAACGAAPTDGLWPAEPGQSEAPVVVAETPEPSAVAPVAWGDVAATADPLVVLTDAGELPELRVAGDAKTKLPLDHTHVKADLFGFVA